MVVEKKAEEARVATNVSLRYDTLDAKDGKKTADGTVIAYSVHRNILELHSDYFKGIFGEAFKESNKKRNIIELPTFVTPQHFETFLNYCYTGELLLHSNNAVAMVYFGDYLDDKELLKRVQYFIWYSIKNASSEDLLAYYRDAKGLLIEDLQKAIEHICAQRPGVMSVNTALSKILDLQFWCNVWEARKLYQNESKLHYAKQWSANAVHFIKQHRDIIDISAFRALTNIDSLPIISPDASVGLMEQEQELKSDDSTETNRVSLTCLQKRCTEALYNRKTGSWRVSKKNDLLERLINLPSVVLDAILSSTMEYKGIPTGIEVSGAGVEDANGVYELKGFYNKKLKFVKRIGIVKCTIYSQGGKTFYLSVDKTMVFMAEHKNGKSSLPPVTGWASYEGGDDFSLPILRLTYD
jgi:hypothetical protein